ncbi:MAG: hypothetical protein F6K21_30795 [Symploca sp. SIO2D2]|nr:hypothetical protein [Symploca sp. SIO2D2]
MNIEEVLMFADKVVFDNTGNHLDDMQLGVIEGVLKRQKYSDIAKNLNCTESYVKDIGYELWQLLSTIFQENVNKSNLRSTLLRRGLVNNGNFNLFGNGNIGGGNIIKSLQFCPTQDQSPEFIRGQNQVRLKAAIHLKELGLTNEQIAMSLDMKLEDVEQLGSL